MVLFTASQNVHLTFHKLTCYSDSRCDKYYDHYYGAATDHCYHDNNSPKAPSDNDKHPKYDDDRKHYSKPSYIFLYKFFIKYYKPYHHSGPGKPPPYHYYYYNYDNGDKHFQPHKHPHGSGIGQDDHQYSDYGSGKCYDYHYDYGKPKGPPPLLHKLCNTFAPPHYQYHDYGSGDDSSYNYNYDYNDHKHHHDYPDYGSGDYNYHDHHYPPYKILQHSLKKLHHYKSHHLQHYQYYDYNYDFKHSAKTPNNFFHYLYHYYYDYHPQGKCYHDHVPGGHHSSHHDYHYDYYNYYDYHYYDYYYYGHHKHHYKPKHKPANKVLQYILKKIYYYKSDDHHVDSGSDSGRPPSHLDYGSASSSDYDYHYPQYSQHHPGQSFYYLLSKICRHYKPPKQFGPGSGSGQDSPYYSGQGSSYGGQDYHHDQPLHHKPPP